MSSNEADRAERLHRMDLAEDDVRALEQMWNTRVFGLTADQRTAYLAEEGYSALDTLDAIWHELDEYAADLCMQYGFTPHQAYLINASSQARNNVWGPDFDKQRVEHLLFDAPLARDLRIKILLVADSPDETDALVGYCTGEASHPDGHDGSTVTAQVGARTVHLNVDVNNCDCPIQPRETLRLV